MAAVCVITDEGIAHAPAAGEREILQGFSPHKEFDTEAFVNFMQAVDLKRQQIGTAFPPAFRANAQHADFVVADRYTVKSDQFMQFGRDIGVQMITRFVHRAVGIGIRFVGDLRDFPMRQSQIITMAESLNFRDNFHAEKAGVANDLHQLFAGQNITAGQFHVRGVLPIRL